VGESAAGNPHRRAGVVTGTIRLCLRCTIAGWRLRLIRPTVTKPLEPCRPDKRVTRHPAMGLAYGIGGRVPFTMRSGVSLTSYAVNGTREAAALPLSIPAAPRGNRSCALRSPPACLTAAGSTRLTRPVPGLGLLVPSMGLAPPGPAQALFKIAPGNFVLSRFASVRHPWRPDLVIPASVRRFQRGHNTIAVILQIKAAPVLLKARFCRPDKAKPPSGNGCGKIMPDGAGAYPGYAVSGASLPQAE